MRIGLISDTHGLVRPEALRALVGVDRIVHAGDVGSRDVLRAFAAIAPLDAVRGNVDVGTALDVLPERIDLDLAGLRMHVLHDVGALRASPAPPGTRIVVAGHSHRPSVSESGGVLSINPGSVGPRRFTLPVTLALLEIVDGRPSARIVTLDVTAPRSHRRPAPRA